MFRYADKRLRNRVMPFDLLGVAVKACCMQHLDCHIDLACVKVCCEISKVRAHHNRGSAVPKLLRSLASP